MVPPGAADFKVEPQPAAEFGDKKASAKSGKVSVGFFKSILEGLGISGAPEVNAEGQAGDDRNFSFDDVEIRIVPQGQIEDAMNTGGGLDVARIGRDRLDAGSVHVAYAYLYAKKVAVAFGDNVKVSVALKADIQNVANVEASGDAERTQGETLDFDGHNVPAAIAFKLGRVKHDGKRWRLRTKQAIRAFGVAPHEGAERDYLPVRGAVLEIVDRRKKHDQQSGFTAPDRQ